MKKLGWTMFAISVLSAFTGQAQAQVPYFTQGGVYQQCNNPVGSGLVGALIGGVVAGALGGGRAVLPGAALGGLFGAASSCQQQFAYVQRMDAYLDRFNCAGPNPNYGYGYSYEGIQGEMFQCGYDQYNRPCRSYYAQPPIANPYAPPPPPQIVTACRGQGGWMHYPNAQNMIVNQQWVHPAPPRFVAPYMVVPQPRVMPPPPPPRPGGVVVVRPAPYPGYQQRPPPPPVRPIQPGYPPPQRPPSRLPPAYMAPFSAGSAR